MKTMTMMIMIATMMVVMMKMLMMMVVMMMMLGWPTGSRLTDRRPFSPYPTCDQAETQPPYPAMCQSRRVVRPVEPIGWSARSEGAFVGVF
jgi:hypothetical protein